MATTPTRRLATLFLVLAVPGLGSLTWLTWQDLENSVQAERERVLRYERLAASYVADSLRFEINSIRFLAGPPESLLKEYRARARFPGLVEKVSVVDDDGRLVTDLNLDRPVLRFRLLGGGALEVRYSVAAVVETAVPALVRDAFSASGAVPAFEAWVIRRGRASDTRPDVVGPLVARVLDPPPIPDSGRIRQYLPSSYPVSPWLLGVRVLPSGIEGYVTDLRIRNLVWALALFGVLALGAGLFLTSLLRIFGALRREQAFSALVSHELKTPLAALRSLSENLQQGIVADASRVREYGTQLVEQTDRLGDMVGKILALSSLESSDAILAREELDAVALAREMAAPLGIVVESPRPDWTVLGNSAALRAALDNLLTNAFRYGANEGEAPWVEVELVPGYRWGTAWVGIAVSDHGPGLSPEEMAELFRPYFRGAQAGRRQLPGSGVGLRMVKSTMRHLGGRVQVRAVPGGGLCVILWLREGRSE